MECKTIAPMVLSGRNSDGAGWDIRNLAYAATRETVTHGGWDTNYRAALRWYKREAHKAERRSERAVLTAELDQYLDDQAVSSSWDAMPSYQNESEQFFANEDLADAEEIKPILEMLERFNPYA